jgi:hypothetical protein
MGTIKTQPPGPWAEQVVDMPGMGPGANRAGWWVSYLNELMMVGKYEEVLTYLARARHTGAITAIIKAKEEMNQQYVAKKRERKASTTMKKVEVKKTTNKAEPYFYVQGKVA